MLDMRVTPGFDVKRAVGSTPPSGYVRLQQKKNITPWRSRVLVELYNAFTEGMPIVRFDCDREEQIERVWALIKDEVLALSPFAHQEENMATQKQATSTTATAESMAKADAAEAKARKAQEKAEAKAKAAAEREANKRKPGEETPVVATIVALLSRKEGATKQQLIEGVPQAKPGYISALLTRILKEKGYTLESRPIEGQRGKSYHVTAKPAA